MTEETKIEPKTEFKMALKEEPKKNNVLQRGILFLQVIVIIGLGVAFLSLYRTMSNQAVHVESMEKDVLVGKDQISSLTAQISSLNEKIKDYKNQGDALEASVAQEKETVASLKKNYDAFETKFNDLSQEDDDKFGRLSKEVNDVKTLVVPVKDELTAIKEDNKKWQKDYVTALSDLQAHVTRAAGLIAQMRDEVNKKIEYISMVQEKMIKDSVAAANAPAAVKAPEPSEEVVHHQVLNSNLPEAKDKADYQAPNPSK